MNQKQVTFSLVSLGCAKNTVDSDSMAQLLISADYQPVDAPDQADIVIVNTCGFIDAAKQESYQVLEDLADQKGENQLLIAAGCLSQRYGEQIVEQVPGVDAILGTRRWMDILDVIGRLREKEHPRPVYHLPDVPTVGRDEAGALRASIIGASA